jgi:hypothetical protein
MTKHQTDEYGKALPKPVALTPEEAQQVAAGLVAQLNPAAIEVAQLISHEPHFCLFGIILCRRPFPPFPVPQVPGAHGLEL